MTAPSFDTGSAGAPILSEFADDPDMLELVQFFVAELPERGQLLSRLTEDENWPELLKLAHQPKGAAGGYGFPTITEQARKVEEQAKLVDDLDRLKNEVDGLIDMCRRAICPDAP